MIGLAGDRRGQRLVVVVVVADAELQRQLVARNRVLRVKADRLSRS